MKLSIDHDDQSTPLTFSLCMAIVLNESLHIQLEKGITKEYVSVLLSFSSYGTCTGLGIGSTICVFTPKIKKKIQITEGSFLQLPFYYMLPLLYNQKVVQLEYTGPTMNIGNETGDSENAMASIEGICNVFTHHIDSKQKKVQHSFTKGTLQLALESRFTRIEQLVFDVGHANTYRLFISSPKEDEDVDGIITLLKLSLERQAPVVITKSPIATSHTAVHILGQYTTSATCALMQTSGVVYDQIPDKPLVDQDVIALSTGMVGSRSGLMTKEAILLLPALCLFGGTMPIEEYSPELQELVDVAESLLDTHIIYEDGLLSTKGAVRASEELVFLE